MTDVLGWCFGCGREVEWEGGDHHHVQVAGSTADDWDWSGCGPVWPGVRVHDQAEADRLIPELLQIDAPGHWLEWVPGKGCLSVGPYLPKPKTVHPDPEINAEILADIEDAMAVDAEAGVRQDWHRGTGRIRWLRISADPDGPPVNIDHVRAVVAQAREAGVPVCLRRCRELPEVSP